MFIQHNSPYRANRLKSLLVIMVLSAISVKANADNREIKAAFIYRLATMTTWSESRLGDADATLCFAIVGDDALALKLTKILDGRLLHERRAEVLSVFDPIDLPDCIVAFFSRPLKFQSDHESVATRDPLTLTLGDGEGFAERGGMVQLVREGRRFRFIVNLKSLNDSNLKLSSKVLRLAKEILE